MFSQLTIPQKILFLTLIGLLLLMVIFSFNARSYFGKSGYEKCIQEKCEINVDYCQKFREINNCCEGAGGQTVVDNNNQGQCIFN